MAAVTICSDFGQSSVLLKIKKKKKKPRFCFHYRLCIAYFHRHYDGILDKQQKQVVIKKMRDGSLPIQKVMIHRISNVWRNKHFLTMMLGIFPVLCKYKILHFSCFIKDIFKTL